MPDFEWYVLLTYPKYKMYNYLGNFDLLYRLRNPIDAKLTFERGQKATFCGFPISFSDVFL